MRRRSCRLAVLLLPGLLPLLAPDARADIAPPPGFVERCTVARQCKRGEEGIECRASWQARDGCREKLEPEGWSFQCQTRGASVWTEVFCRPKGKGKEAPKPARAPEKAPEKAPDKAPDAAPDSAPPPEKPAG